MVSFRLKTTTVCLVHAKELDKTDKKSYDNSTRAKASTMGMANAFSEKPMPIEIQQYLMAKILSENPAAYNDQIGKETCGDSKQSRDANKSIFASLRSLAREMYWLDMTPIERAEIQDAAGAAGTTSELGTCLQVIQSNWFPKWNNGHWDADHFRNYLTDQTAAENVWGLIQEDIFIVVDKNLQVVFANIEKLADLLFGHDVVDLLERAIDLWSFYNPLPFPETSRHVVDRYVRRIHPELDPSKATVETLPNAKMAVAHYGCWAHKGDPQGRNIWPTKDSLIGRMDTREMCLRLFPRFAKAVFGKTSSIIRFLVQPLDEGYYRECLEVFENLPNDARLPVGEENWISLFALGINGYTQRHRDVGDIQGGLAGLFTLGRYKGKSQRPEK
ncbi:hypothetical protein UCRPA7_2941 [Phaeoacremonium minimum UCRPA7]|uniref:Uncharacterized protein n=1 Tax=Phaeoacremonium minimum (strain UCR-PA7) TaxID=1286976 RepID=R8BQ95_PHAM7|nr:hypothetical protein UCRPA7_2941 [Phaeoacremonium minimum UCRPA7]EOO01548.1 hypothetical protein UCRPA7_2941 [Phaeoacremonium minimum UCRPA7]